MRYLDQYLRVKIGYRDLNEIITTYCIHFLVQVELSYNRSSHLFLMAWNIARLNKMTTSVMSLRVYGITDDKGP
jgi:hypothetical protein